MPPTVFSNHEILCLPGTTVTSHPAGLSSKNLPKLNQWLRAQHWQGKNSLFFERSLSPTAMIFFRLMASRFRNEASDRKTGFPPLRPNRSYNSVSVLSAKKIWSGYYEGSSSLWEAGITSHLAFCRSFQVSVRNCNSITESKSDLIWKPAEPLYFFTGQLICKGVSQNRIWIIILICLVQYLWKRSTATNYPSSVQKTCSSPVLALEVFTVS